MKFSVNMELIIDVKNQDEGLNLIREMCRKNKIDKGNFNGGFIDIVLITSITPE